jgi:riboflavin kinase/FMN adenylyltransferase
VDIGARILPGVTNIGCNPTFGGDALSVEVHILDFSGDLYGKPIRVHFVQRLRSERRFSGVEELAARIREDHPPRPQHPGHTRGAHLLNAGP